MDNVFLTAMGNQTNSAIITWFLKTIFSRDQSFRPSDIAKLVMKLLLVIFIKNIIEDTKSMLDKFSIFNIVRIRWMMQVVRNKILTTTIMRRDNKLYFEDKPLNKTLDNELMKHNIKMDSIGSYYYPRGSCVVKVTMNVGTITFSYPDNPFASGSISTLIKDSTMQLLNGKTSIYRLTTSKLEQLPFFKTFSCDNYVEALGFMSQEKTSKDVFGGSGCPVLHLQGEPGTGKTSVGYYLAENRLFDIVILVNLVAFSHQKFSVTLSGIESKIKTVNGENVKDAKVETKNILVILDELDKMIERYVSNKLNEEMKKSMEKSSKESKESREETSYRQMNEQEQRHFILNIRQEILDELYLLFEGNKWANHNYYFIINTNNRESIFEGMGRNYNALKTRMPTITFEKCRKKEVIDYIKNYTDALNSAAVVKSSFDYSCLNEIDNEIMISYRRLRFLVSRSRGIEACVKLINDRWRDPEEEANANEEE